MVIFLVQAAVLFASTLAIWAIDWKVRDARSVQALDGPEASTIVLLCFLINVACLPYYFAKTRSSTALGLIVGFVAFGACCALSILAGVLLV